MPAVEVRFSVAAPVHSRLICLCAWVAMEGFSSKIQVLCEEDQVKNIRNRVCILLEEEQAGRKSTYVVKAIGLLIVFSILLAILATEPAVRGPYLDLLAKLDLVVAILFLVEYLSRLWIAPLRDGARKRSERRLGFRDHSNGDS